MATSKRTDTQILHDIARLKESARPGLAYIHLSKASYARVKRDPQWFGVTKQHTGRLVVVHDSQLVEVVPV
jgi:hypothetical protein